jgi:hypothetical protein
LIYGEARRRFYPSTAEDIDNIASGIKNFNPFRKILGVRE